jgi:GH15 family glucan-1,4-alpha-glucosidase
MKESSIADYALISDSQGAALVSRGGSIDWACLPRFDSPASFARLLGRDAEHWRLAPARGFSVERSYLRETMVLRTIFHTASGTVAVTDAMPFGEGEKEHRIGRSSPHAIIRVVEGVEGDVELDLEFAPRPEYGLTKPLVLRADGGIRTRGGAQSYLLASPIDLEISAGTARARLEVKKGDRLCFAMRAASPWEDAGELWSQADIARILDSTVEAWRSWSALHQAYEGPYE